MLSDAASPIRNGAPFRSAAPPIELSSTEAATPTSASPTTQLESVPSSWSIVASRRPSRRRAEPSIVKWITTYTPLDRARGSANAPGLTAGVHEPLTASRQTATRTARGADRDSRIHAPRTAGVAPSGCFLRGSIVSWAASAKRVSSGQQTAALSLRGYFAGNCGVNNLVIVDKAGLIEHLEGRFLDLGCGQRKASPTHVGIDVRDYPGVDIVGDAHAVLGRVRSGTVAGIRSSHLLEHVGDWLGLLEEIARVLRPHGVAQLTMPHFSNPYYYSDPTHLHPFGLYSLSYVVSDPILKRRVPPHRTQVPLELTDVALEFKAAPPHYSRHAVKRVITALVNSSRWAKEFYEENLPYLLPCYEVRFVLTRLP